MNFKFYKKGFTLIEILFVISLILFLGLSSFVLYSRSFNKSYSDEDLLKIESLFRIARQKTYSNFANQAYGVYFNKIENKFIFYQGNSFGERNLSFVWSREVISKMNIVSPTEDSDINFSKIYNSINDRYVFSFINQYGDIENIIINKFGNIYKN